jgi:hypothetical protein
VSEASPKQLERCDDQEMIERLTYLIQFYVYAEAEEKDVRDLVSSFGADDGYSGYAIVKESALESAQAEIARLTTALTASAETKAAYIGEFSFTVIDRDEDGEEVPRKVLVPWTTTKEIMAAILARAALKDSPNVG